MHIHIKLCVCFDVSIQLIVKAEDVNCISVDWPTWKEAEYSQAANNIRVVGAQVAYMMSSMRVSTRNKNTHTLRVNVTIETYTH